MTRSAAIKAVWAVWIVLIVLFGATSNASLDIYNFIEADLDATAGPRFYDYRTATYHIDRTTAELNDGTINGSALVDPTIGDGALTLSPYGDEGYVSGSWWDTDWKTRRCITVNNPGGSLSDHPTRIEIDTADDIVKGWMDAAGADLRAIAADDATPLDLWIEGPMDSTATVVWVALPTVPSGSSSFCLYWNNDSVGSVSSKTDVFSVATPVRRYFTVSWRFTGRGTNGQLDVVSYVDDNTVVVDGNTQTLMEGGTHTFSNVTADSVIRSTGPIGARGRGNSKDSVAPASFAGHEFVVPTNRNRQRWALVAPFGNARVRIKNGTSTVLNNYLVTSTASSPIAEISKKRSAVITVTSGGPVLLVHTTTNGRDAIAVPPVIGDDLFGVRSRSNYLGVATGRASMTLSRSDGTSQTLRRLKPGAAKRIRRNADAQGDGTAVRVSGMTDPTGVLQQDDRDGRESTVYLPERLLDSHYYLTSAAQYVAIACPTTMTVMVGATAVPCTSPGVGHPGHGHVSGGVPQGTKIYSTNSQPFYAYYEDRARNDETNLFGVTAFRDIVGSPLTTSQSTRVGLYPTMPLVGTWESDFFDTDANGSGVFGLLVDDKSTPTGTQVRYQISSGPDLPTATFAPWVGPDGTTGTFYAPGAEGEPIGYGLDETDQFVRVKAFLATTDPKATPVVELIAVGADLVENADNPGSHPIADGASVSMWVLRVLTTEPTLAGANARYLLQSSSGLTGSSNVVISTDDPTTQVVIVGGSPTVTSGPSFAVGPGSPHSLFVYGDSLIGASLDLRWQAEITAGGPFVQHDVVFDIT